MLWVCTGTHLFPQFFAWHLFPVVLHIQSPHVLLLSTRAEILAVLVLLAYAIVCQEAPQVRCSAEHGGGGEQPHSLREQLTSSFIVNSLSSPFVFLLYLLFCPMTPSETLMPRSPVSPSVMAFAPGLAMDWNLPRLLRRSLLCPSLKLPLRIAEAPACIAIATTRSGYLGGRVDRKN